MTVFDLTRTAIEGGVVLVKESAFKTENDEPKRSGRTYTAQILRIEGKSVRAKVPYKTDAAGRKRKRETVRHWVIEFEEI